MMVDQIVSFVIIAALVLGMDWFLTKKYKREGEPGYKQWARLAVSGVFALVVVTAYTIIVRLFFTR